MWFDPARLPSRRPGARCPTHGQSRIGFRVTARRRCSPAPPWLVSAATGGWHAVRNAPARHRGFVASWQIASQGCAALFAGLFATVLTLGLYMPAKIEYKCAKVPTEEGSTED